MLRFLKNNLKNSSKEDNEKYPSIAKNLDKNVKQLNKMFSSDKNSDFASREFVAQYSNNKINIFYYSTIVNGDKLYTGIIQPLLENVGETLKNVVTLEAIEELSTYEDVIEHINSGYVIIFEDTLDKAFAIDVAQFQHRGIEKSQNESVIKGPKEAFTEALGVNVSLLRKRFHDKQLINESLKVGERSKLEVNLLYVEDLVNNDVLKDVKKRINDIKSDNVRNVEMLEQFLEERPYSIVPSILYTERPDKAATYIEDGYIVILMDNSSACLIVPINFWAFFQSPEDRYLRFLYGNFTRLIRFIAFFITVFISAIYIGVTNYHSEMIPPDLLLAITAARERVPFPLVFEVLLMEIAFELIREAGIRIPNPLGPTIGIVGALILGQAAVDANIISPIVVIIVALSGLTSFAVSDVSMNYSVRLSKYIFITASAWFGMFSLTGAFIVWISYLSSLKSFGVPFFSPVTPTYKSPGNNLFRKALKNEIWRPGNIKPKDIKKKQTE
ncbi:spore germination protein [Aquibacillus salsiterrae]|uniref:Spore germination protein n=1 Tax=Aquibacillus salsiterrae TaxID=2950439 RepID=A0A9X3WG60_9BACI|nr:spore germination protein [Aquibacillus salsiterrae]MDC3417750.1 spore germination protein [Aquibacillus salsiterrae]